MVRCSALSVAGCGASRYTFVGFLPRSANELRDVVRKTSTDVVVALESPARIVATLQLIAELQPERRIVLARELTKLHERTSSGEAQVLAAAVAADPPRGELVLVLDAQEAPVAVIDSRALDLVERLVEEGMRMKDACRIVAGHAGVVQRELYGAAVERRNAQRS